MQVNYTYDADGRRSSMATGSSSYNYAYDIAGLPASTTYPNGVVERRSWDAAARLESVKAMKGAATLSSASLTLDNVGNPTAIAADTGAESYTYDALHRITKACYGTCTASSITYTYDAVGNRTSEVRAPGGTTTSTYDLNDQLTSTSGPGGTVTSTYDLAGRQKSRGTTQYGYDAAGRLTSVATPSGTTDYTYGGDGNRASKATASNTIAYAWDTNGPVPMLVEERDDSDVLQRRWLVGNQVEGVVTEDGALHHLLHGTLGSVTAVTNGAGTKEWAYAYEPFGAPRVSNQLITPAPSIPIRFAGEFLDDTGLYNLRARAMDPASGRFTAPDPLDPRPTDPYTSTYVYANNRPGVLVDPLGESWWDQFKSDLTGGGSRPSASQWRQINSDLRQAGAHGEVQALRTCFGVIASTAANMAAETHSGYVSGPVSAPLDLLGGGWGAYGSHQDLTGAGNSCTSAYAGSGRGRSSK
jgi:RHS repeat-associated protein